jgi:hypothetical protein
MDVEVDQAGDDQEASGVDHLSPESSRMCPAHRDNPGNNVGLDDGDAPTNDPDIHYSIESGGGVDNPAAADEQIECWVRLQ